MFKIKAIDPKIVDPKIVVSECTAGKPYYAIEYYDTADKKRHVGYSSYDLTKVTEWLKTYFDVTETGVYEMALKTSSYEMALKTSSKELYDAVCQLINNFTSNGTDTTVTSESSSANSDIKIGNLI